MQLSSHASSRTSIPRELLARESSLCVSPMGIHEVGTRQGPHTQTHETLKCRDNSWKYQNRWEELVLLDDE